MSMLDQHRRQMTRERDKKLRLSKDVQSIRKRLSEKRPKVTKATTESTRRSRQREVDRLERDLLQAEGKVVDQDKAIATLQTKIAKEEDTARRKRDQADVRRERDRARRDQVIDRDLDSLAETASALDARLTEVEASSLNTLARAVASDPVQRQYDVFLSFATPDETGAGNLRDELQARGLNVWMVDAQVGLGQSLVTGIDNGIGASRCGICFVTPAYVDPRRFWPRQELAALIMGRKRVIPVISGLEFEDVEEFSSLLGDRKGLSADAHGLGEIADLIVDSVGEGTPRQ
ncbi:toll/interleukin-1 receptor domain-containing protein [Pseudactinotalea sp. Z1748]|uniref:toll/interleukin-1 receptor domain-containing protein n=1 Tax=Pseudactinotalea sp. Z1748 TaxID=3413027 RepID=UPI003C7DFC04